MINFIYKILIIFSAFFPGFISAELVACKPSPNLDIINVVWGREFTDSFLKISLPPQLCPGNLGCLIPGSARYRIFTTTEDWEYMQSAESMKKLMAMIPVDFIKIDHLLQTDPYQKMTICHNLAIEDANNEGRALVFLSPDCLISNQTFQTILKSIALGKRVVMVAALRLKKEIIAPIIESLYDNKNCYNLGLDSRYLVNVAMPHIHPLSESLIFQNEEINKNVSAIYWRLDSHNLLAFSYHLHPLFVWPETPETINSSTVDDGFVFHACPSTEKWEVIQDSDEMAIFEFSNYERTFRGGSPIMMYCNPFNVANWGNYNVKPHHWLFIKKPMLIHSSEYKLEWEPIEKEAYAFIQEVLNIAGAGIIQKR